MPEKRRKKRPYFPPKITDFGKIEDELVEEAQEVAAKVHLMSKKIEDFVSEELKELFEEMN